MSTMRNVEHYPDPTAGTAIAHCKPHRYTVTIPGRMPDLNDMVRMAKAGRGRYQPYAIEKRHRTEEVAWCCKAAHIPRMNRVRVKIIWYEPDARRDPDNIIGGGTKPVLDGLVMAGVLDDDSQRYIIGIEHTWGVDKRNPRVVAEIEEANEY